MSSEDEAPTITAPPFELYRPDRALSRDELIAGLASIPQRLRAIIDGRDAAMLERRPASDEWSAMEICRHVRDAVQVYGLRFKWIILDDDPFLPNYDENRWAAHSADGAADLDALAGEVAAYRAETLRLLGALPDEGWSRSGRHELLGVVELESYVGHELAHEEQHLAQLRTALDREPS